MAEKINFRDVKDGQPFTLTDEKAPVETFHGGGDVVGGQYDNSGRVANKYFLPADAGQVWDDRVGDRSDENSPARHYDEPGRMTAGGDQINPKLRRT